MSFDLIGSSAVKMRPPIADGGRLIGTATAQILMTDFGFDPPAIGDLIRADNEVIITFEFVAEPN